MGWRGGMAAIALALTVAPVAEARGRFDLAQVAEKARELARESFQAPARRVPDFLLGLSYDQWRQIRFRPEQALWRDAGSPFQVQFFHPGLFYDRTIEIHVVDAKGVKPVAFSPNQFDYGQSEISSRVPQDLGYGGFRLHYPIKTARYYDEVIVFLGASYFRGVGRRQGFGLSARGLAIDTALPSGEEFPFFREFWLVKPAPGVPEITIYALLDSPSTTGAYKFAIRPGEQTAVDVDLQLFRRRDVTKLGISPLTSMFFFGENSRKTVEDFRPEVHDSDGLLMAGDTGEWIWRPLDNPRSLQVSGFRMRNPRGFGLLQRDRDFEHYQDLEARPELRPSAWVAPRGDWGQGWVELVEIPTHSDTNDNVVAYWVPEEMPGPGEPMPLSYTLSWYGDDPTRPLGGRATATRWDRGTLPNAHRFVVDFTGKELEALSEETVLRGVITVGAGTGEEGRLLEQQAQKNPVTGGWRLVFQVRPEGNEPLEIRAFLQQGENALTETWSYLLRP